MSVIAPRTEDDLRTAAVERLKERRDFGGHLLAYVLVNGMLWVIWAMTSAGFPWPIFPLLGWGIGLVFHFWDVHVRKPISEADIRREMAKLQP
jgi:hypothetical protein